MNYRIAKKKEPVLDTLLKSIDRIIIYEAASFEEALSWLQVLYGYCTKDSGLTKHCPVIYVVIEGTAWTEEQACQIEQWGGFLFESKEEAILEAKEVYY
ncbi:MAG: hypothetical protein KDH96_05965 [Candidatus Riesia sp.]|nr:hypothetical protein [Candidatus Riesia sp.]